MEAVELYSLIDQYRTVPFIGGFQRIGEYADSGGQQAAEWLVCRFHTGWNAYCRRRSGRFHALWGAELKGHFRRVEETISPDRSGLTSALMLTRITVLLWN